MSFTVRSMNNPIFALDLLVDFNSKTWIKQNKQTKRKPSLHAEIQDLLKKEVLQFLANLKAGAPYFKTNFNE